MEPSSYELQQELERFTAQFSDRVTQATETLERSAEPATAREVLRRNLLYVSSAVEIATGPIPEINLMDMIVFVRLSRSVLEKHWLPRLARGAGDELAEVFARSEEALQSVAARTFSAAQRQELTLVVDTWLNENADQVRVEGIRLADFSVAAGTAVAGRAGQAKGLLSSVKSAASSANQALLLSERAMFLVHRLPFLWRLQARLGAREMVGDALAQLRRFSKRGALYLGLLAMAAAAIWWLAMLIRNHP